MNWHDLHAHILPGVDDGPQTMREAVAMARIAAQSGTRLIVATPHRKDVAEGVGVDGLRRVIAELQRRITEQGIDIDLALGMENHLDESLPKDAATRRALTMNGSRYILVEMPFFGDISEHPYAEGALSALQAQGLTPILAHPERIEAFQRQPALLARFIRAGMLSQITRGSLLGHWGDPAREFTLDLLRSGMAHILSSDTHSPCPPRTPELGGALQIVAGVVGKDAARAMVTDIPRAIAQDAPPASLATALRSLSPKRELATPASRSSSWALS